MLLREVKFQANETFPISVWVLAMVLEKGLYVTTLKSGGKLLSIDKTISKTKAESDFNTSIKETKKALRDIYGDLTITEETI
jgi:hypothetical protein